MKTCLEYVTAAKEALGDVKMSDRAMGEKLGKSQQLIAAAKHGDMSDPLAMLIARLIGVDEGEVLMVARLERERRPEVRAAMEAWLGKAFALMPSTGAREVVRGGIRVASAMRQNRWIRALGRETRHFALTARSTVRLLTPSCAATALRVYPS